MATVKQVLAAISQDGLLGPNQKRFVTEAVKRAELWINVSTPAKPRKITNAKNLMTLHDWEERNFTLNVPHHLFHWAKSRGLDLNILEDMVEEFRGEMNAKGKQYADFVATFQTYLRKGYLSKNMEQCRNQGQTVIHSKGINL